jgi:catechol 2,3-dioxygenase-like lactoylglutathione lyase family enzyme
MRFERAVPVLRVFDQAKAEEFYIGYLGFTTDWEHRFEPDFPRYAQISRSDLIIHLSEHHGDGTPGSVVFLPMYGIREFHAEPAIASTRSRGPAWKSSRGDSPWM